MRWPATWISMTTMVRLLLLTGTILVPSVVRAQATITGTAKDTTGSVLPGVTVEVSSPALIEQVRTVETDATGQYRVVDLRPGLYAVTFTLTGFDTFKREGIELSGTFTATVNADLKVGGVTEALTVTGQSPIVDIQSVQREQVLSKEIVDTLPTARNPFSLAVLIPGMTTAIQDVGGTNSVTGGGQITFHGSVSADLRMMVNGFTTQNADGGSGSTGYLPNPGATQEVVIDTSSLTAEQEWGGPRINIIPRDGGNTFRGQMFASYANSKMASSNVTQALSEAGLRTPNRLKKVYDVNPAFGGPVLRNKLWFFGSFRRNGITNYVANMFVNANNNNPNAWTYVPDLSQPALTRQYQRSISGHLTWQVNQKNKISGFYDGQYRNTVQSASAVTAPETALGVEYYPNNMGLLRWTWTPSNRVLIEAGGMSRREFYPADSWAHIGNAPFPISETHSLIGVTDIGLGGLSYRGFPPPFSGFPYDGKNYVHGVRASISYVTGAHAFKFGFANQSLRQTRYNRSTDSDLAYVFNRGVPIQLDQRARPYNLDERAPWDLGFYAQDQWTLKRLTLNLGLRSDYFVVDIPANYLGPTRFTPSRNILLPAVDGLESLKDISPRLGVAYDPFGDGKTAVKVALSRYVQSMGLGIYTPQVLHGDPVLQTVVSTTRFWTDTNGNFAPDCNLASPAANGECAAMANSAFGTSARTVTEDPDVLSGWGKRPYNWDFSTGIQRELMAGVSVDFSYFRRWYGNFLVLQNTATPASAYDSFSITAPVDPRLPGGGGYTIPTLINIKPEFFSVAPANYLTFADNLGGQYSHWNGLDISAKTRLSHGLMFSGGVSIGRTATDNCGQVATLPNLFVPTGTTTASTFLAALAGSDQASWCHNTQNFLTQAKLFGSYTIPKVAVLVAGTFQSIPGPVINAIYNLPNAVAEQALGRPLAGGATFKEVKLVEPGTMFGPRLNQLDLRFSKLLKFGRTRAQVGIDLYNALNVSTVTALSSAYVNWQTPQGILPARFVKVGVQLDF